MIVYGTDPCDPLEQRAAAELARSLRAATGARWTARTSAEFAGKCIAIGCRTNARIAALAQEAGLGDDLAWAGREGYAVASLQRPGGPLLLVAANTPQGALYGSLRVATLAGARFYLSREAVSPGPVPSAFADPDEPWPEFRIAERPRFSLRGALPWFNFLSGPTAWDREDWAVYVDNLARSRANAVAFHVYTGGLERYYPYVEPFIKVEAEGVTPEAELDTTQTARWGYRPLSTRLFAAGGPLLFPDDVFGSEAAVPRGDLRSRYERAQELLRWVMSRAKRWGIKSFLGFEAGIVPPEVHSLIPGDARLPGGELDPFHPAAERIFHRTLAHIVERYPDFDALWLFQHEHVVFSKIPPRPKSALESYCARQQDAFPELPAESRWKGPWLLAWIESASRWKERYAPHLKIAVSGWGGGGQFPKLIPGLHRTMPQDVGIAALIPGQGAGALPDELKGAAGRERIVVPWWEGDAQLWHPQPRVSALLQQQSDFAAHGVDGSIGLHWRTQDIEANAWAFFESCWESRPHAERPAIAFYTDYAAYGLGLATGRGAAMRLPASEASGDGDAAAAGALLLRCETDQWFQGVHSPEYFGYTTQWGRLKPEQREAVCRFVGQLSSMAERVTQGDRAAGGTRLAALDHLILSLKFTLGLDAWSRALAEAAGALESGAADQALVALSRAPARASLRALAIRVMTQGDRGILASVNQRLWQAHRDLLVRAVEQSARGSLKDALSGGTPAGSAAPAADRGTPDEPPLAAVSLPVRAFWDVESGDKATWRVFSGDLDTAAAFLAVEDDSGSVKRLALEQTGPGTFSRTLSSFDLAPGGAGILSVKVEIVPLGSPEPIVPKGGEATLVLFRGAALAG